MKICQVISAFPPSYGGLERATFSFSQELVRKGHQVTVITTSRGKTPKEKSYEEYLSGIKVIRYPETKHFIEAPLVPQIGFRVLRENYDLLHIHGMTPMICDWAIFFGKLKRKPIVVTYHYDPETPLFGSFGFVIARLYNNIAYFLLRSVDGIVATTKSYAETSSVLNRLMDRVRIIPLGINKEDFDLYRYENSNSSLSPDDNCHIILFVGQLKEHKGLRYLLKAMKFIRAQTPDARLIIVGDGPKRTSLTRYAAELNVDDIVSFEGNVADHVLQQYYAISNLLVLPSYTRRDAFGLVLLEAMLAGKPIVASDIPGIREVITGAGLLVPPQDSEKLAKAILEVFSSKKLAKQMRLQAEKNIRQYSWKRIIESYEKLYSEIISNVTSTVVVKESDFKTSKG